MNQSIPILSNALLRFVENQKDANLPVTFVFGAYGDGSLQYDNQPSVTALLDLEPLLLLALPVLPARPRPTAVRASFLHVQGEWKESRINVSSFDDKAWASWASSSLNAELTGLEQHWDAFSDELQPVRHNIMEVAELIDKVTISPSSAVPATA